MSNTARKARKRAGIKFDYEAKRKVGTPLLERAWFNGLVPGPARTRLDGAFQPRSLKKRVAALGARPAELAEYGEALRHDYMAAFS